MGEMDVVVSDEAKDFIAARGGVVHVRSHSHRCCTGPITLLDTTTAPPEDPADPGVPVGAGAAGLTVRYHGEVAAGPHVLTIELRGRRRRRLVSFWDGCAAKP